MDVWTVIQEADANIGQTKSGKPKRGVKTEKGWLQLSGDSVTLGLLGKGVKIRHSEPKQFGKSWYATLMEVEVPPAVPTKPASQAAAVTGNGKPVASPSFIPAAIPTWGQYAAAMRAAHKLAQELEPDLPDIGLSMARARAALVNTAMMAFSKGQIAGPVGDDGIPGSDAPLPDDEEAPF